MGLACNEISVRDTLNRSANLLRFRLEFLQINYIGQECFVIFVLDLASMGPGSSVTHPEENQIFGLFFPFDSMPLTFTSLVWRRSYSAIWFLEEEDSVFSRQSIPMRKTNRILKIGFLVLSWIS
ncbi:hypothetical protein AVEN_114088-1 [Araneus ventricosus]|uniref:Uncharacterized protein n=1 Tax=Araneus ventricosus TaxID=182803 RepID=A0A4Y2RVV4_ARAVE|nr:hypothetical protein AVEN_114088-1 [Araneus ventricosus]